MAERSASRQMVSVAPTLRIPGVSEGFCLELPPEIQALRDSALRLHQQHGTQGLRTPEVDVIDAESWSDHDDFEDWLIWRARRCAARLERIPLEVEPGERIVGKPRFREVSAEEEVALARAHKILSSIPPFPGGDAGHFHPDWTKLFRLGLGGLLSEVEGRLEECATDKARSTFYEACAIALRGTMAYIRRVARACRELPEGNGAGRAAEALADMCTRLASEPPQIFHEAIQLLFMTQIALWFGEDHGLTPPGRLDQTLRTFYEADLAEGRITPREAFELICCLFIQQNRILRTGSAISVLVGGRDSQGRDATNDLTYLCLAARVATRLSYPTVGLAWHEGMPSELIGFAVDVLSTGCGDPAFFNDELIQQGLIDHGVRPDDAHNYMNSTCVEIKVVGQSNIWVTQPYINLPQALLDAVEHIAERDGPPLTYDELSARLRTLLSQQIRQEAERLDRIWHDRSEHGCFPLASCLIDDCLERGLDFDRGGARYNWVENSFVGLANLVDGMVAIRRLVYEEAMLSLEEFRQALQSDWVGYEHLRQRIVNTLPKYGNDDPEADALAQEWAGFLISETESNIVGLHRYVSGFFCWVMHERLGSQTGATPDGRASGWPLADGAGASQGRERHGPTASVLSTTSWSHRQALGGLVHNVKFGKRMLSEKRERKALRDLIETYLRRGGFEIQANVVSREDLLAARQHPERYPDLLVRVAGYSDYFVKLAPRTQDEIIARTEHKL